MDISALKTVLEDRLVRSSPESYGMVVEAFEFLTHRDGCRSMTLHPSRPVDVCTDNTAASVDASTSSSPPESSTSSSALDYSSSSAVSCPSATGTDKSCGSHGNGGGSDNVVPMVLDSPPTEEADDVEAKRRLVEAIAKIVEENSLKNDGTGVSGAAVDQPSSSSSHQKNASRFSPQSSSRPQEDQRTVSEGGRVVRPQLKLQVGYLSSSSLSVSPFTSVSSSKTPSTNALPQSPRPSTIAKECLILLGGNRFTKSEQEEAMNDASNPGYARHELFLFMDCW